MTCVAIAADVRFGSLADILESQCDVSFTSNNGHWAAQIPGAVIAHRLSALRLQQWPRQRRRRCDGAEAARKISWLWPGRLDVLVATIPPPAVK